MARWVAKSVLVLTMASSCQATGQMSEGEPTGERLVRVVVARGEVTPPLLRCSGSRPLLVEIGVVSRVTSKPAPASEAGLLEKIREQARFRDADLVILDADRTKQEAGLGALQGGSIRVAGRTFTCNDPAFVASVFSDRPDVQEFRDAFADAWICEKSGTDETYGCRGPIERIDPKHVRVLDEENAQEPEGCGPGYEITASDGSADFELESAIDEGREAVAGNREVALQRIREAAANRGANVVVLDRAREVDHYWSAAPVDGEGRMYSGVEVGLTGEAFRCPSADAAVSE